MNFKPFKMAQISAQWPAGDLVNLHSSNPEPFTWHELSTLIGIDLTTQTESTTLGYESTQGNIKLRSLIAELYHSHVLCEQIILTSGAQEGIFMVMQALLQPGDEVIGFTPCFEPLAQVAKQAKAKVTLLPLDATNQWQINWQQLEDTLSAKTKLLVINFPHNPTGAHITADELSRLIKMCQKYDCWLLSDEVFRGLEHNPKDHLNSAADLYDKGIALGVVSKSLALPGIRLGWITTQCNDLIQQIMNIKSYLSICQSSLDVEMCLNILPHSKKIWQRNCDIIKKNKYFLELHLENHPSFTWHKPNAAATAFIQFTSPSDKNTAQIWAEKYRIATLPHQAFLTRHNGFRLTLGARGIEKHYHQILRHDIN